MLAHASECTHACVPFGIDRATSGLIGSEEHSQKCCKSFGYSISLLTVGIFNL